MTATNTFTRRQILLLLLLVLMLVGTRPSFAADSCYIQYATFTTRSWNTYEACVIETNSHEWYRRLGTRQLCRIEWLSNAFQAEGDYASCMTGFANLF